MAILGLLICLLAAPPAESKDTTAQSIPAPAGAIPVPEGSIPVPAGWRTEHIDFPLPFAPELQYTGWEELRFAPGMFNAQSDTYFTYAFVFRLDGRIGFDHKSLSKLLTTYFKGLCRHVAEGEGDAVELSGVVASIENPGKTAETNKQGTSFRGTLKMIDVFVTKKPLELNLKLLVPAPGDDRCTCVVVGASPKAYDHAVWQVLDQFGAGFRCPCGDATDGKSKKE